MDKIDQLEERAQTVSRSLAVRSEHERDLKQSVDQLESKMQALQANHDKLATDAETLSLDKERMTAESNELRKKVERLSNEKDQAAGQMQSLNDKYENARQVQERALTIAEKMIAQLEQGLPAEAAPHTEDATSTEGQGGKVVELVTDPGTQIQDADDPPESGSVVTNEFSSDAEQSFDWSAIRSSSDSEATQSDEAFASKENTTEQQEDKAGSPGDATRRLMDRIRMASKNS